MLLKIRNTKNTKVVQNFNLQPSLTVLELTLKNASFFNRLKANIFFKTLNSIVKNSVSGTEK